MTSHFGSNEIMLSIQIYLIDRIKMQIQSFASPIPSALIANIASASGKQGESYILHILVSPLPLRQYSLKYDHNIWNHV